MSSMEDLERACLAAAAETREARAEAASLRAELAKFQSLPTDAVIVPSQTKVMAKIVRNQEDADEVIACLLVGACHVGAKRSECSTCQRTENAVTIVRRLAGL